MNETKTTLPSPPQTLSMGRTLRARWRRYLVIGMNSLIALLLVGATLIIALEQRQSIIRLHESTARFAGFSAQRAQDDLLTTLVTAGQTLDPATATQDDLDRVLALEPALRAISLLDAAGQVTVQTAVDGIDPGSAWGDHPVRRSALDGKPVILPDDRANRQPLLVLAAPTGTPGSVIVALADPQTLWGSAVAAPMGDRGYLYLADEDGRILAAPPEITRDLSFDPARLDTFAAAARGSRATRLYHGLDGSWVVGQAEPVSGTPYVVFTETPLREFASAAVRGLALWAMAVILALILGEWLIRRMVRSIMGPLERLHQGAKAVSQGDYGYRVRVAPNTEQELAGLAHAFNQMVQRLQLNQKEIDSYKNQLEEIIELRARELSRKTHRLEVAAQVSSQIATLRDPRQLVSEVTALIGQQFGLYHVSVLRVDGEHAPEIDRGSVAGWAVRHAAPVYVPDVTQDQRYRPIPGFPASQSELALPLICSGQVIGVLNLESEHRDAFQPDERAVFESLASEIASALYNADAFAKLEQANRDLAQASVQARQANILKSRFLLNASHKLRGPLNAIIGYSETILSGMYGDLPEALLEQQRGILDNGRVMQVLLEDMLDLSAIESGQLQLDLAWLPVVPLLEEIMNASRALHQAAHPDHALTLRLDLSHRREALPPVWADPVRLRYMLMSLMSSAIRATTQGEVVLSADTTADSLLIHVSDTGPGILSEELAYLFDPFQQPRGLSPQQESSGRETGLGLAISRLLAMRHGGDLRVESVPGQGSTFTLVLPLRPEGAPAPA